ncbi:MAG: Smr/MutS family protein [Acidobacteria bacterium]|nr:Smr/MutS family protein [Acidobacteriota bacterium]
MTESPFPDPVRLPIEDAIDLHAFAPKETRAVVAAYLEEAHRAGFHEVRIIHGKGQGVQRAIVRSLLSTHPRVLGFRDAPPTSGGCGATLAYLKAPGESPA